MSLKTALEHAPAVVPVDYTHNVWVETWMRVYEGWLRVIEKHTPGGSLEELSEAAIAAADAAVVAARKVATAGK